jgi:Ca2+/Na+ antiporter
MPSWFNAAWTAAGMAGLSGAAALLLHSAQQLGVDIGLSKEFIGAVTVGLGVSIPELYMSVNSALRKQGEFALGSVIGCNIFTTLLVGGAVSIGAGWAPEMMKITTPETILNTAAFAGSAALATGALMANKGSLKKWHGWTAVALYAAFAAGALALGHGAPTVPIATPAPIIQKAPAPAVLTPKVAYFENYAPEIPVLPALDAITISEEHRALPPVPTLAPPS